MTVFLLLYLCADTTRTDCQVVKADSWSGPYAYEECSSVVPGLTVALTAPNRKRHRFVCEIQSDIAQPAEHVSQAHLYRRAIEAGTGAEVCERYRDYSATNTGSDKAEETTPTIDDYRRDLRWAVRDFLGISRTTVELI